MCLIAVMIIMHYVKTSLATCIINTMHYDTCGKQGRKLSNLPGKKSTTHLCHQGHIPVVSGTDKRMVSQKRDYCLIAILAIFLLDILN